MLALGVDVGGTKVAAGVVDPDGRVLEQLVLPTPSSSPRAVEDVVVDVVGQLSARHRVGAVGVGAAGWVDTDQAVVRFSPHLTWRDEPLRDRLHERLGLPLVVDNDANAAAWAEYRFGAGRDAAVMICLTLGTGIGGALMLDGELFRGRFGMAGEFGHMCVVPGGHWCPCGNRGCWEQYSSGNALERDARALVAAGAPQAHTLLAATGSAAAVTGPDVSAAALAGDPMCVELISDVGHWLGLGLANLAAALDPDLFVVGGGLGELGGLLVDPARRAFDRTLTGRGFRPAATIAAAGLGGAAGMIGAADLARHSLQQPPGRAQGFWPHRR